MDRSRLVSAVLLVGAVLGAVLVGGATAAAAAEGVPAANRGWVTTGPASTP
jgi:hypothetical protein